MGAPAQGRAVNHDELLVAKPCRHAGGGRGEENGTRRVEKTASKTIVFLQSRLVFWFLRGPALGSSGGCGIRSEIVNHG